MPAADEEIEALLREEIAIEFLTAPIDFMPITEVFHK